MRLCIEKNIRKKEENNIFFSQNSNKTELFIKQKMI